VGRRQLLFCFSSALPQLPSAAESLTPPLGFPSRPASRRRLARAPIGPSPASGTAPAVGRAGPFDPRTLGCAGRAGPHQDPASALGLRGLPNPGRRASPVLSSPFGSLHRRVFLCLRVSCFVVDARLSGGLAAPRGLGYAGPSALLFTQSSVLVSALVRTESRPSASSPAGAAGCE
jgi:hypothetical protein